MAKRASLADNPLMQRISPKANAAAAEPEPSHHEDPAPAADGPRDFKTAMMRINRVGWAELSRLSIELDRSLEDMMIEAANDFLRRHGKSPVIEKRAPPKRV